MDVGRHARIKNAIVDKHAKIMPNAEIGYNPAEDKKRFTVTPNGIAVVEKGAIVE